MNILIIQHAENRGKTIARQIEQKDVRITVWSSYAEPMPMGHFDGIIIGGGPMSAAEIGDDKNTFFKEETEFINKTIQEGRTPILGICLGHQILAYLNQGVVTNDCGWQIGWKKITLNQENELFKNCPNEFYMAEFHHDAVTKLPEDAELLASSPECAIEAFKIKNKPIWGIQFHPEMTAEMCIQIYDERKNVLEDNHISAAQEIALAQKVYQEKINKQIFKNFLNIVKKSITKEKL